MRAASADLPTVGVSGGPQLRGMYRGQAIGSGTNIIPMSEQLRAGEVTLDEFHEAEAGMNRSSGHCTSGTACGTVVLHVAPEATAGGPLALVRNGDTVTLDVQARRAAWVPPAPHAGRGHQKLCIDHVLQADKGADLDFLVGRTGSPVPRHNH